MSRARAPAGSLSFPERAFARSDPFDDLGEAAMASKDKGGSKNKKTAGKSLKEKRAAKKAKGQGSGGSGSSTTR